MFDLAYMATGYGGLERELVEYGRLAWKQKIEALYLCTHTQRVARPALTEPNIVISSTRSETQTTPNQPQSTPAAVVDSVTMWRTWSQYQQRSRGPPQTPWTSCKLLIYATAGFCKWQFPQQFQPAREIRALFTLCSVFCQRRESVRLWLHIYFCLAQECVIS